MKRNKTRILFTAAALMFSSLSLTLMSCSDGSAQQQTNPTLNLSLDKTEIYVGETAKVSVTSSGEAVTGCTFVVEGEDAKVISVADDGTVTGLAPGTATIKARKANYSAGTCTITVKAVPVIEPDAVLEFEKGSFYNPSGEWNSGGTVVKSPIESSEGSSGGQSIGYQSQGVTTTLEFTAEKAGTVDMGFVMASTAMDWMAGMTMSEMSVPDVISITVNGSALDLTGFTLPGSDRQMFFTNWSEFKVEDVSVQAGDNSIVVTTIASQGPNMDCVKIYGDLGITQVEPEQVETTNLGTYTYYVGGYEWGPGVYKVVADLGDGNTVKASDLTTDLFRVRATGSQGGERKVTDIYLADASGEEDTSATEGTRIGFDLALNITSGWFGPSYNGCNPFSYDMMTSKNSWASDYGYQISLAANKSLTIGDATYDAMKSPVVINKASENPRVIPCLDDWGEPKSYKNEENNQTLTYKAYETETLKTDSGKNPLIIWLHGAGEGGTDIDIALLGNDVTNLGEEKIQSYFKKDGKEGAYVLAVQTPTFWMDNGEGGQGDGAGESIYKETLMKTIKSYVASNSDIDTDHIYLGGCSNGGFMTMQMAISYNDYFAAYYPICEAKPNANITDENINVLKDSAIWFTAAANDTTVDPNNYTNATYKRLMNAGATDVHYSFFENVKGNDSGTEVEYMGHWSWIYTLSDRCSLDQKDPNAIAAPSTEKVTYNETEISSLWQWISLH